MLSSEGARPLEEARRGESGERLRRFLGGGEMDRESRPRRGDADLLRLRGRGDRLLFLVLYAPRRLGGGDRERLLDMGRLRGSGERDLESRRRRGGGDGDRSWRDRRFGGGDMDIGERRR